MLTHLETEEKQEFGEQGQFKNVILLKMCFLLRKTSGSLPVHLDVLIGEEWTCDEALSTFASRSLVGGQEGEASHRLVDTVNFIWVM